MKAVITGFGGVGQSDSAARVRTRSLCRWSALMTIMLIVSVTPIGTSRLYAVDMKAETLERVKRAAVMVFNAASRTAKGDTPLGTGSGYFINSTGLLITNNHVVDPGHKKDPATKWELINKNNLLVQTAVTDSGTDEETTWDCELLYSNESADQALLQVFDEDGNKLETPNYLRFLPDASLHERLQIVALGFPGGDKRRSSNDKHPEISVAEGHVLEIPRTPAGRVRMIFTDAELRAGNSGGPVVNVDGLLVGTLTLGVPNEERRNFNALVPGTLTREFIRAAFSLGKIPDQTDVTPFVDLLADKTGRTEVPEFRRSDEYDILYYEDGDRIYGNVATDVISWDSALGKLSVPLAAVAYVMTNSEGSSLFLEGGNRIRSGQIDSSFQFELKGGQTVERDFADINVVGFKTSRGKIAQLEGKIIILDSDVCHLTLQDVQGNIKFKSRAGIIEIEFEDIARFETQPNLKHVVYLRDGRRLTGEFDESKISGKIAATQTPIEFKLGGIEWGTIEVIEVNPHQVAGLGLSGLLALADKEIRDVARILESDDPTAAETRLAPMLETSRYRKLPDTEKERIDLLEAQMLLSKGEYKRASKVFRKCVRANDGNVGAYAQACSDLLKRYKTFDFQGQPLRKRTTFIKAGKAMAAERIQQARDLLKDASILTVKNRGQFMKHIGAVKKLEPAMIGSALFAGVEADDELILLWRSAFDVAQLELRRIDGLLDEQKNQSRRGRRNRRNRQFSSQRDVDELNKQKEDTLKTAELYGQKLEEYGFRIEDPDLRAKRERDD